MRGSASSILLECRELSCTRAAEAAARLMDWVPGMLSDRAQVETEDDGKKVFYRARHEARDKSRLVAEEFKRGVSGAFEKLVNGGARHNKETDSAAAEDYARKSFKKVSARELTLVDHEDLSESLKVHDLIRRLTDTAGEELAQLQPRFALLANRPELADAEDPLSPRTLCNAFKVACEKFDSDVRIRMVVLEAFETAGIDELTKLYRDLNVLLEEREVMPPAAVRVQKSKAAPEAPMNDGHGGSAAARAAGSESAAAMPDLFATLQGLLANVAARAPTMPAGPMYATAPQSGATAGNFGTLPSLNFDLLASAPIKLDSAQLMGALTHFQQGDFSAAQWHTLQAGRSADANMLHEIRQSPIGQGLAAPDAGTLDIVARIFDQIFADEKIPSAMKALIGRLQFPLLKVALLDKTFFADTQHPARAMLDVLSEFTLDPSLDADTTLYQRLESLIEDLLSGFDADLQVFEPLVLKLRDLLQEQAQQSDERSRQAVEAIERKERRREARQRAYAELKARASGRSLPKVVLKFLMEEWLKLLYLAYSNKGEDSPAWINALQTLDELVWSLEPKKSADERRQLAAKLPKLLKQLRGGMRAAGTAADAEQTFLGALMRRHTALIEGRDQEKAKPLVVTGPVQQPVQEPVQEAAQAAPYGTAIDNVAAPAEPATTTAEAPSVLDTEPNAAPSAATSDDAVSAQQDSAADHPAVPESDELIELDFTTLAGKGDTSKLDFKPAFAVEEIELDATQLPDEAGAGGGATYSAADLRLGCWVEIVQADASHVPAKLSFVSPNGGVYLFTNNAGAQVAEMRFIEVAHAIRSGVVKPIERVSIFDRAVSGLLSALRAQ